MARTYGIAPVDREDTVADDDNAPLLGAGPPKNIDDEDGHATITSCVGNLANTIIGSGMLTFPLVMASGGILPGVLTCISSGLIGCLGFYLIIIKGLMPAVVRSFYHVFTAPDVNPPWWAVSGHVWIFIFLAFLAPLCFLHRLDSLRHTSYVALFSVFYLVGIVIFCYWFPPEGMPKPGEIHFIHFDKSFVSTFPVQVFAYTCAQNLFPLYNELKSNTQARMNIVIFTSIFSATATYEVIAIFGYLTFGSKVGPNIIAMYPSTTIFIAIGQFAIVIMVMFSYPLQVHPCRGCLDKVIGGAKKAVVPPSETQTLNEDAEVEAEASDPHGSHGKMSTTKHVALTSAIVGLGFMIAYFVDDLQLILSFVGSTGSTTISFILPGLFYFKLFRNDPGHSRVLLGAALALAAYGALIFVFCLTFNIMKVIDAHRT
ncbi:unnamed protein product [Rhizoctonia solani]|uniref:Amino acid transporter transmembrane domain-containing protein n=1 Tax=Rhizoctonia solani TaxID=456999 RepID=A0A8H3ECL6_9AGAM|nr:unnamed protein product [Rhizoctonia solani]